MLLASETYIINADISQFKDQSTLRVGRYDRRNPSAINVLYGMEAEKMYEKLTGNIIDREGPESEEMTERDEWIEYLKMCGESIIKNAESIVGTEAKLMDVTVTIHLNHAEIPTINIDRNFVPEELE